MDGKALAERIRGEVADQVKELGEVGLTTILVGDDPASDIYVRRKQEAAAEVGILARDYRLSEETTEGELLELIEQLNADDKVDGILVQLPLPDQIDEQRAIEAVDPTKDVDGFHPVNAGRLSLGLDGLVAGTPTGIITLLDEYAAQAFLTQYIGLALPTLAVLGGLLALLAGPPRARAMALVVVVWTGLLAISAKPEALGLPGAGAGMSTQLIFGSPFHITLSRDQFVGQSVRLLPT